MVTLIWIPLRGRRRYRVRILEYTKGESEMSKEV